MAKKPVIGIAGELITEDFQPVLGFTYEYTRNNYSRAIIENGGIPCYLPVNRDYCIIKEQIDLCDGLLIPGGLDVNPLFYNREPLPKLEATIPMTDEFQIRIIHEAIATCKPILGSCRGCQVLNVALGGTLFQDTTYATSTPLQHSQLTQLDEVAHSVSLVKGSILYDLFGTELLVNTFHHQCCNELGEDLELVGTSPDGIVEAIERKGEVFVVGVQWHPEMLLDGNKSMAPLFSRFIKEAEKYKMLR